MARQGGLWYGWAGQGEARPGRAGIALVEQGEAGHGGARPGRARQGLAWLGRESKTGKGGNEWQNTQGGTRT